MKKETRHTHEIYTPLSFVLLGGFISGISTMLIDKLFLPKFPEVHQSNH